MLGREAVAVFVDVRGLGLRCTWLLRPGEVSRARLADAVRLVLLADGDDARAEGVTVTAAGVGAALVGAVLVGADVGDAADSARVFTALLGSSASGPPRSTTPPATASVSPAAAAAVITLRPTCTDRE